MNSIQIDENKCILCASCVKDCVNGYLYIKEDKILTHDEGCIECGHCYAICPQNAVIMTNYPCESEPAVMMSEIDSKTLLDAMKSRRTIRQFKPDEIEEDKINKILEAGRYSPTGANAQNVSFTILKDNQREAEEICVNLFRKGKNLGSPFSSFLKRVKIDDNFFFKGAPLVIVISSKSDINGGLASAYMEIMAESLGLGVLYSGFFVSCTKISRKLKKLLDLPKGHKVVSCMVIGYPSVKYKRVPPRNEAKINNI